MVGTTKVSQATTGRNIWIDPSKYPRKYSKYHVSGLQTRDTQGYELYLLDSNFNEDHYFSFMFKKGVHNAIGGKVKIFFHNIQPIPARKLSFCGARKPNEKSYSLRSMLLPIAMHCYQNAFAC